MISKADHLLFEVLALVWLVASIGQVVHGSVGSARPDLSSLIREKVHSLDEELDLFHSSGQRNSTDPDDELDRQDAPPRSQYVDQQSSARKPSSQPVQQALQPPAGQPSRLLMSPIKSGASTRQPNRKRPVFSLDTPGDSLPLWSGSLLITKGNHPVNLWKHSRPGAILIEGSGEASAGVGSGSDVRQESVDKLGKPLTSSSAGSEGDRPSEPSQTVSTLAGSFDSAVERLAAPAKHTTSGEVELHHEKPLFQLSQLTQTDQQSANQSEPSAFDPLHSIGQTSALDAEQNASTGAPTHAPNVNYNQQDPLNPLQIIAHPIQNLVLRSFEGYRRLIKNTQLIESYIVNRLKLPKWTSIRRLDPLTLPEPLYFEHRDPKTPTIGKLKFTFESVQITGLSNFKVEDLSNQGRTLFFKHRIPQLDSTANYTVDYLLFDEIPLRISEGQLKAAVPNAYIKGSFQVLPDILNVWFKVANLNLTGWIDDVDMHVFPRYIISDRFKVERSTINKMNAAVRSMMPDIVEYLKLTYNKAIEMKMV